MLKGRRQGVVTVAVIGVLVVLPFTLLAQNQSKTPPAITTPDRVQTQIGPLEADADGSTTIYFSPKQPESIKRGNWVQTMPGKGWFTILRLYSPLEPFFTKEWRPGEIEVVR